MSPAKVGPDDNVRRLDLWLWFARFFKSRTLATRFVQSGQLRVNNDVIKKAHHNLRVGDVLTFPKADQVRVVKLLDLGLRRGPAPEAQALYEDLLEGSQELCSISRCTVMLLNPRTCLRRAVL